MTALRALLARVRHEEGGWAMATALLLMACMAAGGMALAKTVDTQTRETGQTRMRETAFNLAEAALTQQIFALARDWPGRGMAANPYPLCTPLTGGTRCPAATAVTNLIPSADTATATWQTQVRDNAGGNLASYYDDGSAASAPAYDANGDGKVWVRSQATAKGKTRALVALVRAQQVEEDLPKAALISGRLDISNNGNKVIIDASGGTAQSGQVAVRCTPVLLELIPCAGQKLGLGSIKDLGDLVDMLAKQVSPNVVQWSVPNGPAMSAAARLRLRARAIADGTYYTGCPPASGLSGKVVYIEAGSCSYTSNTIFNSAASPGIVILGSASLYLGGTSTFHGVIYAANTASVSGALVQIQGNATVQGGVLVDGNATTIAGSSKLNIDLDLGAYSAVQSYGSAGVIQNTWREIKP